MKLCIDISEHTRIWLSLKVEERLRKIREVIPVPYPAPPDTPSDKKLLELYREQQGLEQLAQTLSLVQQIPPRFTNRGATEE